MDLYRECNDKNLLKEDEFEATFCKVCKNRKCERAGYAKSTWDERIGSQLERLILNPNLVLNTKGTQWEPLPDFDLIKQQFQGYEVWGAPPKQEIIPEIETPETLPPEIAPPEATPLLEPLELTPIPEPTLPSVPEKSNGRVRVLNTEVGGDMWVGSKVEETPTKIYIPKTAQDPWEVPAKVGSTFKMKG